MELKGRHWLLCYLMTFGLMVSTMAELSQKEVDQMAMEMWQEYVKEIEEAAENAPENPGNELDQEESARAWWSFLKWIPKIVMKVVHAVAKLGPVIAKGLGFAKNKVVGLAGKYVNKETIKQGIKNVVKEGFETIVVDQIGGKIKDYVEGAIGGGGSDDGEDGDDDDESPSSGGSRPGRPSYEQVDNLYDYYDNNEVCDCASKVECGCCVFPPNMEVGCFNITVEGTLWEEKTKFRLGVNYGGTNVLSRRLPAHQPGQKCMKLSPPFHTTKMCFSTHGRTQVGNRMIQCFSVFFNSKGTTKCLVQNRNNKLWFKDDV